MEKWEVGEGIGGGWRFGKGWRSWMAGWGVGGCRVELKWRKGKGGVYFSQ